MANPNPTLLDVNLIMQKAYDQTAERIRVDAIVTVEGTASEVIISHTDDSIRLGDGTNLVSVTNVGSKYGLDVNILNDIVVEIDHTTDSIRLGDGTSYLTSTTVGPKVALDVNLAAGNVSGTFTQAPSGVTVVTYGTQTVAISGVTFVAQYTIPAGNPVYLQKIYLSGESIAKWTIYKNATVLMIARMTHTDFSRTLDLATSSAFGIVTSPGDIIKVEVENVSSSVSNFDATIQTMNT